MPAALLLALGALAAPPVPTPTRPTPPTPPAVPAHARPSAEAKLTSCTAGDAPEERAATFEGRMRAAGEGVRLQMRFRLEASTPDRPGWRAVAAAGFEEWTSAEAGVDRYVYAKRVAGLLAPGRFRALIRFRWLDADGGVVAQARRLTPVCRQEDRAGARRAPALYFR